MNVTQTRTQSKTTTEVVLLDTATSVTSGEWFGIWSLDKVSIHIEGIVNATVQLRGSNKPTLPLNAVDAIQLGGDITSDQIIYFTVPIKWIKVKVSTYSSGTISAYLIGS